MQPAQLSLLLTEVPMPPQVVLAGLPEADVNEAITVLACLIAKAAAGGQEAVDE